ncbi:MAG: hypothetical protein E7327_00370 [Clostridiales bacterium]|nr:hypothetical protein [Clostridiales bacterium]
MNERFSCTLNGISPASIDPAVRVTDLTELPPRRRVVTVPTARHGLRLLRRVRESLTVRVSFLIAEEDPVRRRTVLQALHRWAEPGGLLTVSDRPGQHLTVQCDTLPTMSALCWTDELAIEFTAYAVPFWETDESAKVTTGSSATLTLPGNADECPVGAVVTNNGSAALTTLTLRCGDTQMTFSGLSLAAGKKFTLGMSDGLLYADANGTGALMLRSGDSSDLLLADGGAATPVSVTADQPVQAVFSGRGRLL